MAAAGPLTAQGTLEVQAQGVATVTGREFVGGGLGLAYRTGGRTRVGMLMSLGGSQGGDGGGGFAGLFKVPERYRDPVFVAGADGVGTKLTLAAEIGRFDTVGIDCVAMVVNDLVVQGAEPLVFLDYLAMDDLDPAVAKDALRGIAEGCRRAGCALLGGETATMPGVYPKGEVELVGFGVGVVERDHIMLDDFGG